MAIDKQFYGGLEATSRGQMLAAMTDVEGSAGYVAIKRVSGSLDSRCGTFVLQHSGTMTRSSATHHYGRARRRYNGRDKNLFEFS